MFTISIIGQKGGTGKTTTALGLAVAAARAGEMVALIDLDPQASATNWKDRRSEDNPAVVSAQSSRLRPTLEAARATGANLVIIDTAGRSDDSALNAARMADVVLVPTRPAMIELEALPAARDIIRTAGNPSSFVVLNGIHPQASKQVREAREMITKVFGMAVCPVHLSHRSAYSEALTSGRSAQELDPDGKAAEELEKLYLFTRELVKKEISEHGK
jgi:chromosome partitioning protein